MLSYARTQTFLRLADTDPKHFGLLHAAVPETFLGPSLLKTLRYIYTIPISER